MSSKEQQNDFFFIKDVRRLNKLYKDKGLTQAVVRLFRSIIYDYYAAHGRAFPWRDTRDPYRILVSEIMLQQTQTNRVVEKYNDFLRAFPDFKILAESTMRDVFAVWHGLGYNRRALALKRIAETVVRDYDSILPDAVGKLEQLPGIGKATARSIAVFAFNKPVPFIETNIRSVYIHFFFPERKQVRDKELLELVERTMDKENPHKWYSALMDYGVMLKSLYPNPSRRSSHYKKQTRFEGSNRQLRGKLLHTILAFPDIVEDSLCSKVNDDKKRIGKILAQLKNEGFIQEEKKRYRIKEEKE